MAEAVEAVVGRQQELASLATFLDGLRSGPAVLRLEGEAGAGKTSLWRAGVEAADERSFRVLACEPVEAERQLSFAGLGDLLAPVVDELPLLPEPQRHALRVALLLAEAKGPPPDQRAVSLAVLGFLRELAADGPLLLAIDDVQWLDPPSALALSFAARRLEREPVGLLLSLRLAYETADPLGLKQVTRVRVGPLTDDELARLIAARLHARLPRTIVARLHEASKGNPLFGLELARALLESGTTPAPNESLPMPDDLHRLLRRRLDQLPAEEREALVAAAAAAHPTPTLVHDATGGTLDASRAAGVVELEPEQIRFTHPLLASVVYEEAPLETRRRVHRRLAELVVEPEERARHLAQAAEGPDEEVATALEQAAERARARGASTSAAALADRSVTLTRTGDDDQLLRRLLAAADYHFEAGDAGRAVELLERAGAEAGSGVQRARVLRQLATVRGEIEGPHAALRLYRAALDEAGDDVALRAALHHMLSVTTGIAADAASAEEHGRVAIDLAEQAGDPVLLAQALGALATMEFMLGRGVDRARWERALELEAECGDQLWIDVMPSVQFGRVLFWTGELAEARRIFERLRSIALERGDASRASLEWCLGYVGVRAGDWRWAADRAESALELTKQSGREADEAPFLALKAWVEAHLGRIDEARADAAAAIADATATRQPGAVIQARSALGFLELSLGDPAAALEQLDQADALAQATGVEDPGMYPYVADRIEALTALRRLEEAEALLKSFEAKGRKLGRAWVLATSARCRGFLAATRGQRDEAVSAFEDSLGEQERSEHPLERGRTLLLYGAAERRFQQRRAARALLQSALDAFVELGAPLWAERAQNELRIVGGRAATPGSLTDMERRIAELVAAGNSNQQVANALHVAPKTVEWNLSKVYRKLRVHSRTELAAKLAKKARAG